MAKRITKGLLGRSSCSWKSVDTLLRLRNQKRRLKFCGSSSVADTSQTIVFTPEMFQRMDESDDLLFYTVPRKVVHIDEPAIHAAGQVMAATFAPNGVLLDLMSSWRSHLPTG